MPHKQPPKCFDGRVTGTCPFNSGTKFLLVCTKGTCPRVLLMGQVAGTHVAPVVPNFNPPGYIPMVATGSPHSNMQSHPECTGSRGGYSVRKFFKTCKKLYVLIYADKHPYMFIYHMLSFAFSAGLDSVKQRIFDSCDSQSPKAWFENECNL